MTQQAGAPLVIGPMGVGQVVDAAFTLMRRNYRYLVAVAAWGIVTAELISLIAQLAFATGLTDLATGQWEPDAALLQSGDLSGFLDKFLPDPLFWPLVALAGLVTLWTHGALLVAYGLAIDHAGRRITTADAYRAATGRVLAVLMQGIFVMFLALILIAAIIAAIAVIPPLAFGLILLLPAMVYVSVRLTVALPVLFIERRGPISALMRSWQLTNGAWWHTLGVGVVAALVLLVVVMLAGALGGIAGVATVFSDDPALVLAGTAVVSMVMNVLVAPLSPAFSTVLLYELRARTEGFDIAQRAQ